MARLASDEAAGRQAAHSRRGQPCHKHRRASAGGGGSDPTLRARGRPRERHRRDRLRVGRPHPSTDRVGEARRLGGRRQARERRALGIILGFRFAQPSLRTRARNRVRRPHGYFLAFFFAVPGAASFVCLRASAAAGRTWAAAACSLFCQPLTTPPSPAIMAAKPFFATWAGSSFSSLPTLVSSIPARRKNSVSVGPGIKHVTV